MQPHFLPRRLVDGQGGSWRAVRIQRGITIYHPQAGPDRAFTDIVRDYPGTRPVAPAEPASWAPLVEIITAMAADPCRRMLLTGTLCAALDRATILAGPHCPLTAGDPDSRESEAITVMAYDLGPVIAADPARHDTGAARVLADIITDWVKNPVRYVEVAGTLAHALALVNYRPAAKLMDPGLRDSPHRPLLEHLHTACTIDLRAGANA